MERTPLLLAVGVTAALIGVFAFLGGDDADDATNDAPEPGISTLTYSIINHRDHNVTGQIRPMFDAPSECRFIVPLEAEGQAQGGCTIDTPEPLIDGVGREVLRFETKWHLGDGTGGQTFRQDVCFSGGDLHVFVNITQTSIETRGIPECP